MSQDPPPISHNAWIARIVEALREADNQELVAMVFDVARQNIRDAQSSLRRSFIGGVLLGLLFLVVTSGSETEVEVFGVQLSDVGIVAKTIPVAIAYVAYDAAFNFRLVDAYRQLLAAVVPVLAPSLAPTNAHRLLYPPTASLMAESLHFGPEARPRPSEELPRQVAWFDRLVWVGVLAASAAAVAFVTYVYVRLIDEFGAADVGVWVSLLVSLTFAARLALLGGAAKAVLHSRHTLPGYARK